MIDADTMYGMPVASKLQQTLSLLRHLVDDGTAGDRLPSETLLAKEFGVSRVTVRQALTRLWIEGKVIRRWGAGTFIAETNHNTTPFRSIYVGIDEVPSLPALIGHDGHSVELTAFSVTQAKPPSWAAKDLKESVWAAQRCLHIDGTPAVLIRDYLPLKIAGVPVVPTALADLEMDLPRFFREAGVRIVKQESTLSAVNCEEVEAELLSIPLGIPIIRANQRAYSERGDVVSCAEIYYRDDAFRTVVVRATTDYPSN